MSVFEIIVNNADRTIVVGTRTFTSPDLRRRPEIDSEIKSLICGDPKHGGVKALHEFYASKLGCRFNYRFRAANYWLWIGRRMTPTTGDMLRHAGRHWQHYNHHLVQRANEFLHYVNEAERDGLFHLIPAIVVFGDSPSGIKKTVGKGIWRQIANNSRTRNKLIMQAAVMADVREWGNRFVRLLDFQSGVIPAVQTLDQDEAIASKLCRYKTRASFEQTLHVVRDTRRMLGAGFNPNWGLARMREEHDLAVRHSFARRYSTKPFADAWSMEADGFTATLLNTQMEIATEGKLQHHCVASYADLAKSGRYCVIRIDGRERATAGLTRDGNQWRVDQVYGACNSLVSEECRKFAQRVAASIERERLAA